MESTDFIAASSVGRPETLSGQNLRRSRKEQLIGLLSGQATNQRISPGQPLVDVKSRWKEWIESEREMESGSLFARISGVPAMVAARIGYDEGVCATRVHLFGVPMLG